MAIWVALRPKLRRAAMAFLSINWVGWVPRRLALRYLDAVGLCDWSWYASEIMRQPHAGRADARRHLLDAGLKGGPSPCPLFDANWYGVRFPFITTPLLLLLHYSVIGERLGFSPSPWFDPRHFRATEARRSWKGRLSALGAYLGDYRTGYPHPLFDQDWYLEQYPDVQRSGMNPLVHLLYHGLAEGRLPNVYISPQWYLEAYPDVANAALDPVQHYIRYGAAEHRSPGPDFNARQYVDMYPDAAEGRTGALAHYLSIGRRDGRSFGKRSLGTADLRAPAKADAVLDPVRLPAGVVDIVLPVYRGLGETSDCIASVLRSVSRQPTRLHIYNDCSPEPEVTAYLRKVAAAHPQIRLVENTANLGFVRTVNAGMRHALSLEDSVGVLLLNSDTKVASNWMDRLAAHARSAGVGTVTALSNNATICSYPKFGPNTLPPGASTDEVDRLAGRVNAGMAVVIPTGVGFCMLISRACLEKVGIFDEDAFGKGYGEENDFCMRASRAGFTNLLAMDVFVEHVGEVSFADDSKPGKILAQQIIDARYPDYGARVSRFCMMDPGLPGRIRLTAALWKEQRHAVTFLFTHAWGGGTERAVQCRAKAIADGGSRALIVRPIESRGEAGEVQVVNPSAFDGFEFSYRYRDAAELCELIQAFGATEIQVHHLVGFGPSFRKAIALSGMQHSFHVHDYYTICPQITLTRESGAYCGEPGPSGCDECIAARPSNGAHDIRNWRVRNEWAVRGAVNVVAPSQDTALRMQRYFGRPVDVVYHEELEAYQAPEPSRGAGVRPYRIALLGVLAPHKGLATVIELARLTTERGLPFRFELIGYPQGEEETLRRLGVQWTGPYEESQLDLLLGQANADAFLFLSQAPETYSYTLSHALRSGKPVAANRLGAFTERLRDHPFALLLDPYDEPELVARELEAWLHSIYEGAPA